MSKKPKYEPTDIYFYLSRQRAKCMIRDDAFDSNFDPVGGYITDTQQILISHVCDLKNSESTRIPVEKLIASLFYGREQIRKCYRR